MASSTGALLVNRGHRANGARSAPSKTKSARTIPLHDLFAAMGGLQKNPLVRANGRHTRRSPITGRFVKNRGKKANLRSNRTTTAAYMNGGKRNGKRKKNNTYTVAYRNGKGRGRGRGKRKTNPLLTNRRSKRNPLLTNRRSKRNPSYRYNPGFIGSISESLGSIPLIGFILKPAVMGLTSAGFGAAAVYPSWYVMKKMGDKVPVQVKPFAYTLAGALLSGLAAAFLPNTWKMKGAIVAALGAAGGAVDAFRHLSGSSGTLAGEYGWEGDYGDDGGYGADGLYDDPGLSSADYGSDGSVHPAEWGDASLIDAMYADADFSDAEMGIIEMGRTAFRDAYGDLRQRGRPHRGHGDGSSRHAGRPGARWGWLAYWIGHDQMKALKNMPPAQRQQMIQKARHAALEAATAAVKAGHPDTAMERMDQAGLLSMHGN